MSLEPTQFACRGECGNPELDTVQQCPVGP